MQEQQKREDQKELTKILLEGFGLSPAEKRALLIEVMQDINLIQTKVIEEVETNVRTINQANND